MNLINYSSILQNFGKNVNFGNFQNYCRVNLEICVFVSTYPYVMSVLCHTFFFTFGNVTDSQSLKKKTNHSKLSNCHRSATANKAIHISKERVGLQNKQEHHIIWTKYEAMLQTAVNTKNID